MWWIYLGIIALVLDLFVTSFYLFGVGLALLLTGVLTTWVFTADSWWVLMAVMSVSTPVSVGIMHVIKRWALKDKAADVVISSLSPVGAVCHIVMKLNGEVKLGYSGSQWPVLLEEGDTASLNLGDRVEVLRQDGVVLVCKKVD